jgi:RNA polymerase sigma factor (sigma-70 family)
MTANDLDLLRQFTRDQSQDAFTALVNRHVNLVYSAALRQVRSPQLAEEIAQSVFADLARDAGKLKPDTILTAWLYQVARRTAIDVIRKESRRQLREQIAVEMNNMNATANDWMQIEPLLDDAMAALDETDRSAILLRYFENKNLREVGAALGTSDDAAQKRVSRAVEQLREFFSKRNVTIGASGLAILISANAVQAAPIGLAATISAAAILAGTAVHTSTIIAATKTIAMTTLQKTLVTATLAAAVGTGIFEAHQASQLREQNQTLQQQQTPLAEQIQKLQRAHEDATNQLADLLADNLRLRTNPHEMELLKLRGEVTRLRPDAAQVNDPTTQAALAWVAKKEKLQKIFAERPDQQIPELRFLKDKDWLNLVKDLNLDSEDDIKFALHHIRTWAKMSAAPLIQAALKKFIEANNGNFPADTAQLKPYFDQPIEDEILQRYRVLAGEENKSGWLTDMMLVEKTTVNKWQEPPIAIGLKRTGLGPVPDSLHLAFPKELIPAMQSYQNANNRHTPSEFSELKPYVTTPEQENALDDLIKTLKAHQAP